MATIVELASEGTVTLQQTPNKTHRRGKWANWIEDTVQWMDKRLRSRRNDTKGKGDEREIHSNDKTNDASLNLGEGRRAVGRAIANLIPGAHIAGADRRDHTYTGTLHGTITTKLKHD